MAKKSSIFGYAPIVLSLLAIVICYFLYRRIESDDTDDRLFNFILKQNDQNKTFKNDIEELKSFVEEPEPEKEPETEPEDTESKAIVDITE